MSLMDSVFAQSALKEAEHNSPGRFLEDADIAPGSAYEDFDRIRSLRDDFVSDSSKVRWQFERLWFESMLFYIGNQWIVFDSHRRQFRQRHMRKWVPKPYTNRFASTADAIMGILAGNEVRPTPWPATGDSDDVAAASVAQKVMRIIEDEIQRGPVSSQLAPLVVLNGDAFALPYYDKHDKTLGERYIEHEYCMYCGHEAPASDFEADNHCPECKMIAITQPAQTGQSFPHGRLRVEAISPLSLYMNLEAANMQEVREWVYLRSYPLDVVKATWPLTGKYVQAVKEPAQKESQHYLELLTYITHESIATASRAHQDHVPLYTHFRMPCETFPEGLVSVSSGDGTILEVGPSPFYDDASGKTTYYNPLVKFSYRPLPNRLYSKTPMFDLISKQKQRNRLESLIELATMKGVYNSWLLPTGSSISTVQGEPAQLIRWTPTGTQGAEPKVVNTSPFPAILIEWLNKIDSDFEELAGTYDALKGQSPRGVSAGYAIQLLTERSYGRLSPVMTNWTESWVSLYRSLLLLFRQNVTEERLYKIRGDTGTWEVESFIGADLTGNIDLKMEGGANRPKTQVGRASLGRNVGQAGGAQWTRSQPTVCHCRTVWDESYVGQYL